MNETWAVRPGGLYRCCILHLEEEYGTKHTSSFNVGDVLTCKYCKEPKLILAQDGVWEWNQRKEQNMMPLPFMPTHKHTFNHEGTAVVVTVESDKGSVAVQVESNGQKLGPAYMQKIERKDHDDACT